MSRAGVNGQRSGLGWSQEKRRCYSVGFSVHLSALCICQCLFHASGLSEPWGKPVPAEWVNWMAALLYLGNTIMRGYQHAQLLKNTQGHARVCTRHSLPVGCYTGTTTVSYGLQSWAVQEMPCSALPTEVIPTEPGCYSAFPLSKREGQQAALKWKVGACFLVILILFTRPRSQGCPGFFCEKQEVVEQKTGVHRPVVELWLPPPPATGHSRGTGGCSPNPGPNLYTDLSLPPSFPPLSSVHPSAPHPFSFQTGVRPLQNIVSELLNNQ